MLFAYKAMHRRKGWEYGIRPNWWSGGRTMKEGDGEWVTILVSDQTDRKKACNGLGIWFLTKLVVRREKSYSAL